MNQPNWKREVRQRIHGVGNVGSPKDIKFFTEKQITESERKLKNLETTKQKRIKNK